MFNVRRIRCERSAITVRLNRVAPDLDRDLRHLLRLEDSVYVGRLLVTARLNEVVATSTLIMVENLILVRNVKDRVRRAMVRHLITTSGLVNLHRLLEDVTRILVCGRVVMRVALIRRPRVCRARCNSTNGRVLDARLLRLMGRRRN